MATTSPPANAPPADGEVRSRRIRRRRGVAARWAFRTAVFGLLALNAWLFVRDQWPIADLRTIRGLVDRREYDRAEPGLREQLRRSPNHDEARMLLARVLAGRKQMLACATELHRVPYWSPRKPEARFLEGQVYLEADHARPAETALRACIDDTALHPTPPEQHKAATELLIELFATEDRWAEAQEAAWKTYERVGPIDRPAAIVMWLRAELEQIDPKKTTDRLRRYLAADPLDHQARRALAKAEDASGNPTEAIRQIQLCAEARPDDANVWRDWLKILRHQNDTASMTAVVARLPRSADADPEIWEYRGMVREADGDLPGAAEAFGKAAAGKPFDEDFHYRLALVENRLGRRDEAREHLQRSKVLRQARGALLDTFLAYRDALSADAGDGGQLAAAAAKLADLCRTLGIVRVADALAENHPRPKRL